MADARSRAITSGISVVIPTYGRVDELLIALESVVPAQTWPAEIVVVDDFSPVPLQVPARNSHGVPIRLYRQPRNRGAQAARNLAIRRARFDHIAFLDSDDWFFPEKLERVHQFLNESPCDVLIHDAQNMETYARLNRRLFPGGRSRLPFWLIIAALNPAPTPALVVRRGHQLAPPSMRFCEDWAFLIRRSAAGLKVRHLPEMLSHQARNDGAERLSSSFWKMRKGELRAKAMHCRQPLMISGPSVLLGLALWTVRVVGDIAKSRYSLFPAARSRSTDRQTT